LFYNRLISFINKNNVLHINQFGFRANKSTSLALANVLSSLIDKCNSNKKVVFALLDLKKAFDLINHKLLLEKLSHYGVRGLSLLWLTNYLNNRTQRTKVNDLYSNTKPLSAGVPQGSLLGPILFVLFINDVFQLCSENIEIFLYADDTALIFHADNADHLQRIINDFFVKYLCWCTSNCIIVNPLKSNYLSFNVENVVITINGNTLNKLSCVKYLGVLIDDQLNWKYHVNLVVKQCCQRIGLFKKVLPFFTNNVALLYYNAFIRSGFSYCLMFWFNNDRSGRFKLIDKINHLVALLAKRRSLSVLDFINKFGVRDVMAVYKLQCLSFMYNISHSLFHVPFFPLICNNAVHCHNTRNSTNLHVNVITSLDKRNFVYHCVLIWNACPVSYRKLHKSAFMSSCTSLLHSL
jgi:hypothetical protein